MAAGNLSFVFLKVMSQLEFVVAPLPIDPCLFYVYTPCLPVLSWCCPWKHAQAASSRLGEDVDLVQGTGGATISLWVGFLLQHRATSLLWPLVLSASFSMSSPPLPQLCRSHLNTLGAVGIKQVSPAAAHTSGETGHSLTTLSLSSTREITTG